MNDRLLNRNSGCQKGMGDVGGKHIQKAQSKKF
jgi:hypothetical protein